ncbi:MAG: hypothetical protein V4692_05685 [Bdellovibrionota bacterium]
MRKQEVSVISKSKVFLLGLVIAAVSFFEYSASAMSKESAELLNQAALQAREELSELNKQHHSAIRTRVQSDTLALNAEPLMLPAFNEESETPLENQVASVK